MLQKLTDKSTGWIAKIILVLLTIPFAFFGMEQYLTQRVDTWAAQIEAPPTWWTGAPSWWPVSMLWQSEQIDAEQFRIRFQQARQQQQQAQGDSFDPRDFENAQNKREVLDQMIDERVQQMAAARSGVVVGDALVRDTIQGIPDFQVDGRFNPDSYQLALASQVPPRSPREFEQLIRDSLQQSVVTGRVAESAFVTDAQFERIMTLLDERRDIAYVVLPRPEPVPASAEAAVGDAQIRQWYDSHAGDYRAPETVSLEYVEIDAAALPVPEPDEAALRQRYEQERARFVEAEQRLASHILVRVEDGADAATLQAAKTEAAQWAGQAAQPGADFAALARAHSDDAGSSGAGGDLGWISQGSMGEAFDAALFALEPGQVSDPVETDFGWHVIQLREVKAGEQVPFEQVSRELAREQTTVVRESAYNDLAGRLLDEVYKNPNVLAPAARAVGLPMRTTQAFARGGGSGIAAQPAVQGAAFSEVLIEDGTVSDPIEIAPNHSVVIRVAGHTPERARPLTEVRDRVVAAIRADRIDQQALAVAEAMVAELRTGASLQSLAQARELALVEVPAVPRGAAVPDAASAEAVFAVAPPVAGAASPGQALQASGRRVVFAVGKVIPGDVAGMPEQERALLEQQLAQMAGQQDAQALVDALRQRMTITVAEDRL